MYITSVVDIEERIRGQFRHKRLSANVVLTKNASKHFYKD